MKSASGLTSGEALYTATAVIELGAGCALLCFPSVSATLLLGAPLVARAALTVARVGGCALIALGVACWLARGDTQSRAAKGLVAAMVIYNLGAVVILGGTGLRSKDIGVVLWAAVALHAAMTSWCMVTLFSWTHATRH
ncbi:MAG: hypothetical protein WA604_10070, partial [Candidatus Sulfotelmatobacter sp.]